jgi:high-affinity K+ transport system ATPase subunit B
MPTVVLVLTGIAAVVPAGTSSRLNLGPHGLTDIPYAFTSMANNNGSAFAKLDPRVQVRNPVMFVVLVGSVLVTLRFAVNLASGGGPGGTSFTGQVALWLWFTVLFANFAEAMAEGRGKAQADELRRTGRDTTAHALANAR